MRIAIIGAEPSARARHLPRFLASPVVRVVGICNRHRESAARVARVQDPEGVRALGARRVAGRGRLLRRDPGRAPRPQSDFATGARDLQFTEAVARGSRPQSPVTPPGRGSSNPSL
ncbi:MAG: hypothetical protein ACM35G_10805 [Planctomycetaceae bacterium]